MHALFPRTLSVTFVLTMIAVGCSNDPTETTNTGQPDAGESQPDASDSQHDAEFDQDADADDFERERPEPGPGSWRLPENYYIPAKMEMTVVHPREEAPPWAFSKNAHPGVYWEIPIVIQGGAWPFQYEIVDDGGAQGLEIGGELQRESDGGFFVHRVTEEYGLLWWNDPKEGSYEITVQVNDQDNNSIEVPISLEVSNAGWIFVDPDRGDDENDGTLEAPFATIERIHEGGEEFAEHRVYLSGVVPMDGNRDNGNMRVARDTPTPRVWVGFPGSDAVLEAFEGKIVLDTEDFYLANLEHRHHQDYFPDDGRYLHMITVWGNTDRYTIHDVNFSRFQGVGVNEDLGNSSIMMLTNNDNGRNHVAVVNNTLSGSNGILTSSYQLRYSVFEKNRAIGADFKVADGSVWSIIYIKGGNNENVTLRANEFWDNNEWTNGRSALGFIQARNIEVAYNTIHTPYTQGRTGAMNWWTNDSNASYSWMGGQPVWIYRNSFARRISYEGDALVNMPDDTVRTERNILQDGEWPTSDRIVDTENLSEGTYFNEQMKLVDEARDEYLGRYGAEIAVPE